jgi:hypothetical protein
MYTYTHSWASAFRHPVSQSDTGLGPPYSGTGLVPASAFLFIPVLVTGCRTVRHSGILKKVEKGYKNIAGRTASDKLVCSLQVNTAGGRKRYPARPYCWWWKEEPCTYVHNAGGEKGYTLHVHAAAGVGRGEKNTPCTSILLPVERDTCYTSKLLVVESHTPCTSIDGR